jgi:hypothetical protein
LRFLVSELMVSLGLSGRESVLEEAAYFMVTRKQRQTGRDREPHVPLKGLPQ